MCIKLHSYAVFVEPKLNTELTDFNPLNVKVAII